MDCGETEGLALGHSFVSGVCTVCGEVDESLRIPSEGLAFEWNDEGTAYVLVGIGSCTDADIVVPEVHNDFPVTAVADRALDRKSTRLNSSHAT